MKNYSDFQKNKTYNYKTYSADGKTICKEVNIKYLFSYAQNAWHKVDQFFLNPKSWEAYHKKNKLTFPDSLKKNINDRRYRYILCEKEVVTYDINGVEFSRETKYDQHDKSSDIYNYLHGKKIDLNRGFSKQTRTLYTSDKIDKNGNPRVVLTSGAIHYGKRPTRCFIVFEGRINKVGMITLTKRKKLIDLVENTSSEVLFNSLWDSAEKVISQYNCDIDSSVKRIEKGEFFTQDEVDSRLEVWENKSSLFRTNLNKIDQVK